MDETLQLTGARVAIHAGHAARIDLRIRRGHILPFDSRVAPQREYDLSGHLLLPGLINAHDHLEFDLFPRLGQGPWRNARDWAAAIHRPDESPVKEHRAIPRAVRLMWGAIRNLVSGVTTVAHHNPYEAIFGRPDFPVRVLRKFGWAHSLDFAEDLAARRQTTPPEWPFILHAAEGVDACAQSELTRLDAAGLLDHRTVLIHATGATAGQLQNAAERGTSVVWCPSSNLFMFGSTLGACSVRAMRGVSLGTDSAMTAAGDLLDELRLARRQSGLAASQLYPFVTCNPARALRLTNGEGTIREAGVADLVAVRDTGQTPAEALLKLRPELVLLGGRTVLQSERFQRAQRTENRLRGMHRLHVEGRGSYFVRAPIPALYQAAANQIGPDVRLAGKLVKP